MWSTERILTYVIVFFVRVAIVIICLSLADYLSCAQLFHACAQISVEDSYLYIAVPICVLFHIIRILVFHCTASAITSLAKYARSLTLLIYTYIKVHFEVYQLQQELNNIQAHLNQLQQEQDHLNQQMNNVLAHANQILQQQQQQQPLQQQGQNVAPAPASAG